MRASVGPEEFRKSQARFAEARVNLLYYCPFAIGGIVEYAAAQAAALARLGIDVVFLTAAEGISGAGNLTVLRSLEDEARPLSGNRIVRQALRTRIICRNVARLRRVIRERAVHHVLFASYSEYGAPLWSGALVRLSRSGVRFGAVAHDPYRDYVAGPEWWHRWSIRAGYSFIAEGFVHENLNPAEIGMPAHVRLTEIPHGAYDPAQPAETREEARRRLNIPVSAKVLLSFGQIRDGKNLDLILRALSAFPDVYLVVAGKEAGGVNRPLASYRQLADELGVSERCRWMAEYIPAEQATALFLAADLAVLAYSRAFRSASGVLNLAVQLRKPCLVSCGPGPLRTQMERYRLGVLVEPDNEEALKGGLRQWLAGIARPLWSEYLEQNSWSRNAEIVRGRMFEETR